MLMNPNDRETPKERIEYTGLTRKEIWKCFKTKAEAVMDEQDLDYFHEAVEYMLVHELVYNVTFDNIASYMDAETKELVGREYQEKNMLVRES